MSRQGQIVELSGTRQSVGYAEGAASFEEVEVDLSARLPAMVYAFTDGVVDQMGGARGRKLLPKGLREVLLEVSALPCEMQEERVRGLFDEWKGSFRQLDDVTLVGVRLG